MTPTVAPMTTPLAIEQVCTWELCAGCHQRTRAIVEIRVNGDAPVVDDDGDPVLVLSGCEPCGTGMYRRDRG